MEPRKESWRRANFAISAQLSFIADPQAFGQVKTIQFAKDSYILCIAAPSIWQKSTTCTHWPYSCVSAYLVCHLLAKHGEEFWPEVCAAKVPVNRVFIESAARQGSWHSGSMVCACVYVCVRVCVRVCMCVCACV